MDEMVDFPSQVHQKVEYEDLLVQLVKESCNLILCIFYDRLHQFSPYSPNQY